MRSAVLDTEEDLRFLFLLALRKGEGMAPLSATEAEGEGDDVPETLFRGLAFGRREREPFCVGSCSRHAAQNMILGNGISNHGWEAMTNKLLIRSHWNNCFLGWATAFPGADAAPLRWGPLGPPQTRPLPGYDLSFIKCSHFGQTVFTAASKPSERRDSMSLRETGSATQGK